MDRKPRITADCDIPFLKGVLEPFAHMTYKQGSLIGPEDVCRADALITRTRTRCDASLLEGSAVRLIATATIGHDHIDSDYCSARGIRTATAEGCNARGVLQYITAALTGICAQEGCTPGNKTLGVIGVGNVGGLIAEYGRIFGFRVLCCDPPRQRLDPGLGFLPLETLLPQCDIVTAHVPLIEQGEDTTAGMASERFFTAMKPGAAFINTSRGRIVSDAALVHALRSGRLAHAVIDTWNGEPDIDPELLRLATFATPHIAGYSIQGKAAGTAAVVRAVSRFFGFPLDDWYPPQVRPSRPDPSVTWDRIRNTIRSYFDIEQETAVLKANPARFESLRNRYNYRTEYF